MNTVGCQVQKFACDIISKDGNFVELLSCNEYAIWYMIRYLGIKSSLPAMGTKAFLTDCKLEQQSTFGCYDDSNVEVLLFNLQSEFGMEVMQLAEEMELKKFIKQALDQEKIVYTYYDHYYNSFYDKIELHDYHGHIVASYDENEKIYYGLFGEEYKVRFEDLENMRGHCLAKTKTLNNRFFYLDFKEDGLKTEQNPSNVKGNVIEDYEKVLNDWKEEIELFADYVKKLPLIYKGIGNDRDKFLLDQRLLFNSVMEGLHYNMVFRFRMIYEMFDYDSSALEADFIENRKSATVIANMFRKLYIYTREDYFGESRYITKICDKIQKIFVTESADLMQQAKEILLKVREKHGN